MSNSLARQAEAEGGCLRFDRFMQLALYDPEAGYYTAHAARLGREGDFSTSATLSDSLGYAIAAWAKAEAARWRFRRPQLIELGAGDGSLARTVLRRLGWRARFSFRYHIVEISTRLRKIQRERLRGQGVLWHPDADAAVEAADGEALLFSNEFVDAFPCRRFIRGDHGWREIFFCYENGRWYERSFCVADLPDSSALNGWTMPLRAGQRVEVHESYGRWLSDLGRSLKRGSLLTIDYGGSPREVYGRRPDGTLRAYSHHQRLTGLDVYRRPGHQDLTADVNFEDLERWGAAAGLAPVAYVTQQQFLLTWGPQRSRDKVWDFLADPEGAGSAFKVLHQRKEGA
ncbi:MAG: SAM-dependent methyltransferase [Verrucomicrobia bacterium]|nr:SAM-dependent methyltransferase [Verrucomicrobiota bacterium]